MTAARPFHPPTLLHGPHVASITARQADVLAGICQGHTNGEIATRLWLSEQTVKTHLKRLLRTLGARNRAHAAALVCSGQLTVLVRDENQTPRSAAA